MPDELFDKQMEQIFGHAKLKAIDDLKYIFGVNQAIEIKKKLTSRLKELDKEIGSLGSYDPI